MAPGFLAARSIGQPRATVAAMREAMLTIRQLLAGDAVQVGSGTSRLRNVSPSPTPVLLLAAGPKMVELAGEVADGALVMVGLDPGAVRQARQHLAEGARRAGRSLSSFPVVFIVNIALAPTREAARQWVQRWFAPGHAWLTYPSANLYWLRHAGIELSEPVTPDAIPEDAADRIAEAFGLTRYRSLGCVPCTGTVNSCANAIPQIITELRSTTVAERSGRAQDEGRGMETLRKLGHM